MKKNAIFVIFLAISLFCNFAMGETETIYLIGVEAGTGGTADASTKAITQLGTTITITATPKDGYRFNKWTYPNSDADECEIGSTTSKSTTLKVNGACTVKANFTRQYTVTLTSEESGTVKFKSKTVDNGSSLTIEATPGEGYLFYKWISNSDNCTVNDEKAKKTTVKVNGNCTVKAYFEIEYWITLVAENGNGVCSWDHISQYQDCSKMPNGTCSWGCPPNYGYRNNGAKFEPDPEDCHPSEENPSILHQTKPCVVTYLFIKVDTLRFVWQPDNNTPTQKTADTGSEITIDAYSTIEYAFDHWELESGKCTIKDKNANITTIKMSGDCNVRAKFKKKPKFTVTVSEGGSANYSSVYVNFGSVHTPSAFAQEGYKFVNWTNSTPENCTISSPNSATTDVTINKDCNIKANFEKIPVLTATVSGTGGSVSPTSQLVEKNTTATITATPDEGYVFDRWEFSSGKDKCVIADKYASTTKVTPKGDCSVKAYFVIPATINVYYKCLYDNIAPQTQISTFIGKTENISIDNIEGYHFSHWEADNNCTLSNSHSLGTDVRANNTTCNVKAYFVPEPAFIFPDFISLDMQYAYYDDEHLELRFFTPAHEGWRYITLYHYRDIEIWDYGSDSTYSVKPKKVEHQKTQVINANLDFQFFVKEDNQPHYYKITDPDGDIRDQPFWGFTYPVRPSTLTIETDGRGYTNPADTISDFSNVLIPVTAYPYTGYEFKQWECLTEGCGIYSYLYDKNERDYEMTEYLDSANAFITVGPSQDSSFKDIDSRVRANFTFDTTVQPVLNINTLYSDSMPEVCANVAVTAKERKGNIPAMAAKDFSLLLNGDTTKFRFTPIGKGDSATYELCFDIGDSIMKTGEYQVKVSTIFVNKIAEDDTLWHATSKINKVYSDSLPEICTNVSVSALGTDRDIRGLKNSNFAVTLAGDTVVARMTPIVAGNKASYDLCFDAKDTFMNGEAYKINVFTILPNMKSSDTTTWQEPMWNAALKIDTIYSDTLTKICTDVTASVKERKGTMPGLKDTNFVMTIDGKKIPFTFKSIMREKQEHYTMCFNALDSLVKSKTQKVKATTNFMKLQATDSTTWKPYWHAALKIDTLITANLPDICAEVAVSVKERKGTVSGLKDTNFVVVQAGDTVPFTFSSIKREKQEYYSLCVNAPIELVNGEPQQFTVNANFARLHADDTTSWKAKAPRDADVDDSLVIAAANGDAITRTTDRLKFHVYTQNFADDVYYAFKTLDVRVSCKNSGDEETIAVKHQKSGLYSSSDVKKNEGKVEKGDNVLTCESKDYIIAEFKDPVYSKNTRAVIKFGSSTDIEYSFFDKGFTSTMDSVEKFETEFGFSVTAYNDDPYNIDTITVTLFTNHRDTIRAKAVETSRNSSEFRGTGRFSFTITEKEMEEGRLDMPLKLDAKNTRAVIRAEIEGDESHVRERDSMVITYSFIAADSAEILDRDGDGEADYVRVHFARSIEKESIGIDTVFWGEEGDEGRGIEQSKLKKSKDKRWIEAPLNDSFGYGITFLDPEGWGYLTVSRASSSATQNVPLIDKISPVPLTAVKHPGIMTDNDLMKGCMDAPYDTLVVTLSEPLVQTAEDAWENLFYLSEECESEEKWELYVRKPPETDDSETKWTIIVPNDVDLKTGYCLTMNPEAGYTDEAGNTPSTSGVIISGEDGGNYLYGLKASPAIAGFKGNRDKWVNPETLEWETIPDTISCIRTETKTSYKADIAIYDNEGHVVATFQRHFGKNLEIGNTLYESPDKSTYSGFLDWDQRTNEGRRVGTGVYIWKIHFTFKGGHKELRVIKTGIRRN